MRALLTSCGLAFALLAVPATALTAKQTVETETLIANPDGTETRVRAPATTVTPGERVVYTIDFTNDEAEATSNMVLTLPVPTDVQYIEGTAEKTGATLTVSADGGDSFSPRGAATVMREGEVVRATADDITHIRWVVAGPLAPGGTDSVTYKGVLR